MGANKLKDNQLCAAIYVHIHNLVRLMHWAKRLTYTFELT